MKSNRLEHLKHVAAAEYGRHKKATAEAIQAYLNCGAALLEAKESCGHGAWLPWLTASGVPERTAQRMMKLAAEGFKSDTVTDLGGIRAACDFAATAHRIDRANYLYEKGIAEGVTTQFLSKHNVTEKDMCDVANLLQWKVLTWGKPRTLGDLAAHFQQNKGLIT